MKKKMRPEVPSPEKKKSPDMPTPGSSSPEEALFLMPVPEQTLDAVLVGVPFLGPTRARALADMGIRTLADLGVASPALIGGVKGIGLRNAERIKEWLAAQDMAAPGLPPSPPDIDAPPVASPDPALALENATIFDGLGEIDALIILLRGAVGDGGLAKKLERQFDRVGSVTAELAEGPDTLSAKQLPQAVKLLNRIVGVLQAAVARKRLSEKKQETLAQELRKLRKELQKVIEG